MKLELHNAGYQIARRWIVRGLTLELCGGTLLALLGPNGSGKSTLLRLLGGLWRPSEGAALLDGQSLQQLPRHTLARAVAYTPQDTHLDFAYTVREIVAMGRHPHLSRFQAKRPVDRAAITEAMQRADVGHLSERLVTDLSGGERQRVLIARSLATSAPIILLDEPTANLDIAHTLDVLELCRVLARDGKAICLALHDLNLAARYADQVALLEHGRLAAYDTTAEVLTTERLSAVFGVSVRQAEANTVPPYFWFELNGAKGSEA